MAGIVDALALKLGEKICHHWDAHVWWLEMKDMVDQIVDENTKLHKENKQLQSMIDKFIVEKKNFQHSYQEIKGMVDEAVEKSKKLQDENLKHQDMIDKGIVEENKNFQHEIKEREASIQEKLETMKNMFEESKREHQEITVKVNALVEENKTLQDMIGKILEEKGNLQHDYQEIKDRVAPMEEQLETVKEAEEAMHTQPFRYIQPFRFHYSRREQCAAPSPIREEPQQGDSLKEQEEQKMKEQQPTKPAKRKARSKGPQVIMDNQIMIPGNIYQSWLKDPSSLTSKRRRVSSKINLIQAIKIGDLMDLPPVALMSCSENSPLELYYPQQLMQLWKECTKVKSPKPSSSGDKSSSSQEPQPRNSPPQPQGENQNEMGAQPMDFTDGIENMRANKSGEFENVYDAPHGDRSVTPGSPGLSRRSASSSGGSGRRGFLPLEPELPLQSGSGRPKRRQLSSGRSLGNLDPVEEEFPMEQGGRDFKLRRLSDIEPTPDLMVETEPTQTPFPKQSSPPDHVTESIHLYLKLHFESPDAPQSESLSQLTYGMNTAQAARLFY